jgi:hypothetical protein
MASKIKLVQGDTRPTLRVTLTDDNTGAVIDLTDAEAVMFFRKVGETVILDTLTGAVTDAEAGQVAFPWNPTTLATALGEYEGEIQVTFADGNIQTAFTKLRFTVRADF